MKRFAILAVLGLALASVRPAFAQSDAQAEIRSYHLRCEQGERKACVVFGMAIEHHRDMQGEWRRTHPEWFWYER